MYKQLNATIVKVILIIWQDTTDKYVIIDGVDVVWNSVNTQDLYRFYCPF